MYAFCADTSRFQIPISHLPTPASTSARRGTRRKSHDPYRDGARTTIDATAAGDGWTAREHVAIERLTGDVVGTSDGDIRISTAADTLDLPAGLMPEIFHELRRVARQAPVWLVIYRAGDVWHTAADCASEAFAEATLAALEAADECGYAWRIVAPSEVAA